ncbi:hypothetical protein SDJN03_06911, partial [Cucurbita argyrosperma subsp. sororia]
MKEKTEDMAKEGTKKATETVQNIGEKAKRTVEGAWEAAKDTTQKIKERVVGSDEDERDEDERDEDVVDVRRKSFDQLLIKRCSVLCGNCGIRFVALSTRSFAMCCPLQRARVVIEEGKL